MVVLILIIFKQSKKAVFEKIAKYIFGKNALLLYIASMKDINIRSEFLKEQLKKNLDKLTFQ